MAVMGDFEFSSFHENPVALPPLFLVHSVKRGFLATKFLSFFL
jgi:hypothetical protein